GGGGGGDQGGPEGRRDFRARGGRPAARGRRAHPAHRRDRLHQEGGAARGGEGGADARVRPFLRRPAGRQRLRAADGGDERRRRGGGGGGRARRNGERLPVDAGPGL